MTTLLSVLLLAALPPITDQDLVSADNTTFLSLRPGKTEAAGAAWILRETDRGTLVGQGRYSLFEVEGLPRLQLLLCRCWRLQAKRGDKLPWKFDDLYYHDSSLPRGVDLEVLLDAGKFIITAVAFSRCSRQGVHIEPIEAQSTPFFSAGEIVHLKGGTDRDPIAEELVPSYVTRKAWQRRSQKNPQEIFGTRTLNADWYGWGASRSFYLFSFRQAESWDHGDAWLISVTADREGTHATACRGTYDFSRRAAVELETLRLEYTFRRIYKGESHRDDPLKWTQIVQSELTNFPGNMEFSVPLTDQELTASRQPLVLEDVSYVDSAQKKTVRTYTEGFFGLRTIVDNPTELFGIEESSALIFASGTLGVTLPLKREYEQQGLAALKESPPPGLELRPFQISEAAPRRNSNRRSKEDIKRDFQEELREAEKTLLAKPKDPVAICAVARLLSTSPEQTVRDGNRAVKLAYEACTITNGKEPYCLTTLAAAYAEAGDFTSAIQWQTQAMLRAPVSSRAALQSRLSLYRRSRPFREQ